jgi:hypothetical protein
MREKPPGATGGIVAAGAEATVHGEEFVLPTTKLAEMLAAAAASRPTTYRALVGLSYPRPGGPIQTKSPGGKDITSAEIHVEAGTEGLDLPATTVAALLPQGAIEVWPPPPPPPPGSLTVVVDAGNLSLAQNGQLSETKE